MAARRHWAAVLSRQPMSPLPDPHPASAAVRIGTTTYVSSVLPWRSCGSGAPWVGENHASRTENAVSELVSNVADARPLVWGGDWNHALTGREYAGSQGGRRAVLGSARHPRAPGSDGDAAARHRRPAQHRPRRGAARPRGHRVEGLGPARRQAPVRPRRVRPRRRGLTLRSVGRDLVADLQRDQRGPDVPQPREHAVQLGLVGQTAGQDGRPVGTTSDGETAEPPRPVVVEVTLDPDLVRCSCRRALDDQWTRRTTTRRPPDRPLRDGEVDDPAGRLEQVTADLTRGRRQPRRSPA